MTPTSSRAAAVEFCRLHRLAEPQHIRLGTNDTYRAGDMFVRVGTNDPCIQRSLMSFLAQEGLAVVAPADLEALRFDDWWVTAWPWRGSAEGRTIDGALLGETVERLHQLPIDDVRQFVPLPDYNTFPWLDIGTTMTVIEDANTIASSEIEAANTIDTAGVEALHAAIARLGDWWSSCAREELVVCHADVHPHNVLTPVGGQFLIDWDSLCLGPRQLDHAAMITWERQWGGRVGLYESFARGYGTDFRGNSLGEMLATFRNLVATVNMVARGITDLSVRTEAQRRLQFWTGDPHAPQWTAQ